MGSNHYSFLAFNSFTFPMAVVINRANKGFYNAENVAGLRAVSVFWHFVGFLWLYLYVFLEYIN